MDLTKRELLEAAKKLGIKGVNMNTRLEEIRSKINAVLGNPDSETDDQRTDSMVNAINKHGKEAVAKETGAVRPASHSIPNLSPTGVWEGKRAKIRRAKTGHNDMDGAIFNWNGWITIVPIDQVVDVAWPIFGIIQACKGMNMTIKQEEDGGRVKNVKNITYFDKYPFQFLGVTPGTEDLPESAWEYTLDQYVDDFSDFTVRKWRQLCVLWEINDEQAGIKPGLKPEDESVLRRNAIHYHLNLPESADLETRLMVRNEKREDIGMEAKAA